MKTITLRINESASEAIEELKSLANYKTSTKAIMWAIQRVLICDINEKRLEADLAEKDQEIAELKAIVNFLKDESKR